MSDFIETQHTEKPPRSELAFAILCICVGLGLIIGIAVNGAIARSNLNNYIRVTGTVIDYKISTGTNSSGTTTQLYAEIAQFEVNGTTYTVTNSISSTSGVKQIGETVEIAYNPDNPSDCIFITSGNRLAFITALVIGILFTLFGGYLLFWVCIQYKKLKDTVT